MSVWFCVVCIVGSYVLCIIYCSNEPEWANVNHISVCGEAFGWLAVQFSHSILFTSLLPLRSAHPQWLAHPPPATAGLLHTHHLLLLLRLHPVCLHHHHHLWVSGELCIYTMCVSESHCVYVPCSVSESYCVCIYMYICTCMKYFLSVLPVVSITDVDIAKYFHKDDDHMCHGWRYYSSLSSHISGGHL